MNRKPIDTQRRKRGKIGATPVDRTSAGGSGSFPGQASVGGSSSFPVDGAHQRLPAPPDIVTIPATDLAFLETVLAYGPAGFALLDREFRFVRLNERLAEINGRPVEDHICRTLLEALGREIWETRRPFLEKALAGEASLEVPLQEIKSTKSRTQKIVGSYIPVKVGDESDEIVGIAAIIRDMTDVPATIPGLSVAHYYRPALDEAEVGGDFADCFPLDKDHVTLAVGDLSGKGLAAAVQVAAARNMLRFAIYNWPTLSESVTKLNSTLVQFNLVVGFATLFAACYDASRRVLTYINCGQEPALMYRRSTDTVEALSTTGPVVGAFENFELSQREVELSPGDIVAIFTDGLTEIGKRSADLLGAGGVAALLKARARELDSSLEDAERLVERLVDDVSRFAAGQLRDDICLLVAIAQD